MLLLASRSPQRRAILEQLGVPFHVEVPDVEELAAGQPVQVTIENARRKARALGGRGATVLAADTVVVLDGQLLGKPRDGAEAESFLRRLSGRAHEVVSGLVLLAEGHERSGSSLTRVEFRSLGEADVEWYLGTGEWRERAGAYAIQGRGAALVERVEGDFWNVVGLPVSELLRLAPELLRPGA